MRTTQIKCTAARLASRLPPRLRRCLTTLPEEASTGETPQRLANDASLPNLSGLSPTVSKSVAGAHAGSHADQLLCGEFAQTAAELLWCRHHKALELVGGLASGFHR